MADVRDRIRAARGFIFDMDGTIALGDRASGGHVALPGAVALLATLRRRGTPFRVFTNGSAKHPRDYAASLRRAGFDLADGEMLTPSSSAAAWLDRKGLRRVRVLGDAGTAAPLREIGLDVIGPDEPADGVAAVYTGWFRDFTFHHIERAFRDLEAGARLVTASHVPFFATADGKGIGTSFPLNTALKALSGTGFTILGKPSRAAFDHAVASMGLPRSAARAVVVVGDDPLLEMRMANAAGAVSIGVATGLQSLAGLHQLPERDRPLLALAGVSDMQALL